MTSLVSKLAHSYLSFLYNCNLIIQITPRRRRRSIQNKALYPNFTLGFPIFLKGLDYIFILHIVGDWHFDLREFHPVGTFTQPLLLLWYFNHLWDSR